MEQQFRHSLHFGGAAGGGQLERHQGVVVCGRVENRAHRAVAPAGVLPLVGVGIAAIAMLRVLPITHNLTHGQGHTPHRGVSFETGHRGVCGISAVLRHHAVVTVAVLVPLRHQQRGHAVRQPVLGGGGGRYAGSQVAVHCVQQRYLPLVLAQHILYIIGQHGGIDSAFW